MAKKRELLADPEIRRVYEEELLFGEATDTVAALVESLGLTQRELARRLGVSEGRVSQILSGKENLTLRSLASLGWALGMRFDLEPRPMVDRAGTPAADDPPAPAWLTRLRPEATASFRPLGLPEAGRLRA
jgi:transcriptional regulator with XRE-family HTH domain